MSRERHVYVVNSRLSVYKVIYWDDINDVVNELFTRITPKNLEIGEEIASQASGVLCDKLAPKLVAEIVIKKGKGFRLLGSRYKNTTGADWGLKRAVS